MASEYDPLFTPTRTGEDDLEPVQDHFRAASQPFLRSPWSWVAWALVLPAAALATPVALKAGGFAFGLFLWSGAILLGGAVEMVALFRSGGATRSTPLASWVLRLQGNLSLVAVALSIFLLWQDQAWALPGLWLLLLGHSFYMLGGLAFEPFRACGILFQLGGAAALWPDGQPLLAFAAATFVGNLWMALGVWRSRPHP
ncbi:MAG TPA: hypothetical protein VKM72_09105 [Thermoanaerobaculia bacterium]|nr:hypothetical protein [Thermoanaerobaculia bacterium]